MDEEIKVAERFAGVGGFRLGLEGYCDDAKGWNLPSAGPYRTVWANHCSPATTARSLIPARHILLIQALHSLNGTPGEIRTHTILILSQTPHTNWATGAYGWVCATTLALLGCPPASYSHSVWDATKVSSLLLSKILDFYQAPRSLPDYYCLTPPIVLAAVFSTAEIYIG